MYTSPMDPMGVCFRQDFLRPILPAHPLVPSNGGALGLPQHASGAGWVQRRRFESGKWVKGATGFHLEIWIWCASSKLVWFLGILNVNGRSIRDVNFGNLSPECFSLQLVTLHDFTFFQIMLLAFFANLLNCYEWALYSPRTKQPTSWIKYGDNVLRITGVMISQGEKPLARR